MAASELDLIKKVGIGTATTLSAPGKAMGTTSITVGSTANFPTTTGIVFAIRQVDSNGELVAGTYTEWSGTVTSGTTLAMNATPVYGSDQVYTAGSTTQVYIPLSSYGYNKLVDGIIAEHSQLDGTHSSALVTSRTEDTNPDPDADFVLTYDTSATALKKVKLQNLSGAGDGWVQNVAVAPTSTTYNGNRSYTNVYASSIATYTSVGMRKRFTRTVSAPTQCADLESSSSQYFSKTSPNKLTFTDDYTTMAWVKLESYVAGGIIARRNADTEGWSLSVNASGQVLAGSYRIAANNSVTTSYQSLPLNKWVHVAASVDLSGTSTLIYIDGVLVSSSTTVTGTCTALVQGTTALVVGAEKSAGTNPFDGKLAQVAVFDAVLSAATIRSYASQTLSGSETNLKSAYSFNNSITDLNTTTPNDLTAQGSAVATNVDTPFGNYLGLTLEYGITTSVSSDGLTEVVQVPEGCALPTSGGVSAVAYSTATSPFGFTLDKGRWAVVGLWKTQTSTVINTTTANLTGLSFTLPVGLWQELKLQGWVQTTSAGATNMLAVVGLSSSSGSFSSDLQSCIGVTASISSSVMEVDGYINASQPYSVASQTPIYGVSTTVANQTVYYGTTNRGVMTIQAIPAGV